MRWLHLSDIHYKFGNFETLDLRQKLKETLKGYVQENGAFDFILITGDCLFKNEKDYNCIEYIKNVCDICEVVHQKVFICPGNHDVNRGITERNEAIQNIREKKNSLREESKTPKVLMDGYDRFENLYYKIAGIDYQHFSVMIPENCKCRIVNIDSCLLSKDNNDFRKLKVCVPELNNLNGKIKKDEYLNIAIMHHGVDFLEPSDAIRFQHWLDDNHIDVLYCGHSHAAGMVSLAENFNEIKQFTCGPVLLSGDITASFYICEYNESVPQEILTTIYTYSEKINIWKKDENGLRAFRNGTYRYKIPRKTQMINGKNNDMAVSNNKIPIDKIIENEHDENILLDLQKLIHSESKFELDKIGSLKIYNRLDTAQKDIANDIKSSTFFEFLGLRGNRFIDDEDSIMAKALINKGTKISTRILVSNPFSDEIRKRFKDLKEYQDETKLETKWRRDYISIKELRDQLKEENDNNIRFHKMPIIVRLFITDKHLYFNFYEKKQSLSSNIFRVDCDTQIYDGFKHYFETCWNNADSDFSDRIPDELKFLEGPSFKITPMLVVNITDKCNMKCRYCPPGGENLYDAESEKLYGRKLCDIDKVVSLVRICHEDFGVDILRITGGEPFIDLERTIEVLKCAQECGYGKIVLCTNGVFLKEKYTDDAAKVLESIKDVLLIKVSLDTLDKNKFIKLTRVDKFQEVYDNIIFASKKGYKIELNVVASKENIMEISDIFNFARSYGVSVKVLTVNDFGGRVPIDDVTIELNELVDDMRNKGYIESNVFLNKHMGIRMKRFTDDNGCTLTIVDHKNSITSITPRRTFSQICNDCDYFPTSKKVLNQELIPCATGVMNITLRGDGLLQNCRLRPDKGIYINQLSDRQLKRDVKDMIAFFEKCYFASAEEEKSVRKKYEKI